jgi:NadR type nicotinamide-nucleotide adenylyltransferase
MSKPFQRGLVVGKFCPLHRGHERVIHRMLDECRQGFILSYTNPEFDGCEPAKRRRWLTTLFPAAHVFVLDEGDASIPPNDADDRTQRRFVGAVCREVLGTTVQAVFTSEAYCDGFADELTQFFREIDPAHPAVQHVCVDPQRLAHAISGTELRAAIHELRHELPGLVYADFVKRICLLGGESSGKSTLAAALAQRLGTSHVAEYGRELWEQQGGHLSPDDLGKIARVQIEREDMAARDAHEYLVCDTSPLTTLFYSHSMFGTGEPEWRELADRDYTLHVLCAPDFPFVQDGTRKDHAFRMKQHEWYRRELLQRGVPWLEIGGPVEHRVSEVARWLTEHDAARQHPKVNR